MNAKTGFRVALFLKTTAIAALALLAASLAAIAQPSARLIHFTEDGTATSPPLLPGFALHSLWSAMGQTADGRLYVAVSNHSESEGNVALFRMDPGADRFTYLTDLKSVSQAAGNWREGESQYKVHTFLHQHADGLIYFATMPSDTPQDDRGAHLYTLDPATDTVTDLSATAPQMATRSLEIVPNTGDAGGVLFAGRGVKGMGLNPAVPDLAYTMTFDGGHLFRHDLATGDMAPVGISASVAYVFHVDAQGDAYYLGGPDPDTQAILRYDAATERTTGLVGGIPGNEEIGMIAPTANPDIVLVLMARSKRVFPINTAAEKVLRGGNSCGKNFWKLFNMAVSPDGKWIYFVSNNNNASRIWRTPVGGGRCDEVLDVDALLGPRNLAFGGRNIWVGNSFFTPVWTHQGANDLAILKVTVD
ncbi:MAG: PD40 domain-containing protein [Alphaproteobacteria bacterium]|nr:PD40 domain-containing protein [Alphaproteobacteria bacterium]